MSVRSARPKVNDLIFRLIGRSIHPELYTTCTSAEVHQKNYSAVLKICETGHIASIQHKEKTVCEILTSFQNPLPSQKRVLEKPVRGCRSESAQLESGLYYQVSYQLEELDYVIFNNLHEEYMMDSQKADLAYHFVSESRITPGALSIVDFEANQTSLLIHAFHTFPEELAVVKTQSLFEF
ncbi:DUF2617 family protein [Gimesia aquarii]|uniref:DUF2617 domain-containing protein n=1 Tax=Gimesia aquarii TaxID=2527964 RepID=A0A517VPV0_9PLAN|nr:DUF2617 family protein [Gimesia aquarii]QDT95045.1 hypothetical protein V144x_04790 [Gimesia aquarii]